MTLGNGGIHRLQDVSSLARATFGKNTNPSPSDTPGTVVGSNVPNPHGLKDGQRENQVIFKLLTSRHIRTSFSFNHNKFRKQRKNPLNPSTTHAKIGLPIRNGLYLKFDQRTMAERRQPISLADLPYSSLTVRICPMKEAQRWSQVTALPINPTSFLGTKYLDHQNR